jgi:hypothetical protein
MKKVYLTGFLMLGLVCFAFSQDNPLQAFVGRYIFPEGNPVPYVDVKLVGEVLVSESPAGTATLQQIEGDRFSVVEYEGLAEFVRNADKKVVSVKVSVMGYEMEGKREEAATLQIQRWHPLYPIPVGH